ncbi:MAG: DedA family protein [Actinobacteria bacterium]|nr:DedA family protein [Actinomycetota bacterium]MDA2985373.1 DedA family protein [Actinomycetota bacterium]
MWWISIPGLEFLNPEWIIGTLGVIGVLTVLFVETGLLVGLVLPGDSMLFLAGIAASGTAVATIGVKLPLNVLLIGVPIATFLGSQLGYYIGRKFGPKIFNRPDGKFFTQHRVEQTEQWLLRYGVGKALFLSRFIPVVRTLINPICGVARIDVMKFAIANAVSATIWGAGFIYLGYVVGERIEGSVDRYLLPITIVVIVLSFTPVLIEYFRERKKRK